MSDNNPFECPSCKKQDKIEIKSEYGFNCLRCDEKFARDQTAEMDYLYLKKTIVKRVIKEDGKIMIIEDSQRIEAEAGEGLIVKHLDQHDYDALCLLKAENKRLRNKEKKYFLMIKRALYWMRCSNRHASIIKDFDKILKEEKND